MPRGNPDLTPEQAFNVAAFVTSQPRPHFVPKE
jgi:cytochrome c